MGAKRGGNRDSGTLMVQDVEKRAYIALTGACPVILASEIPAYKRTSGCIKRKCPIFVFCGNNSVRLKQWAKNVQEGRSLDRILGLP